MFFTGGPAIYAKFYFDKQANNYHSILFHMHKFDELVLYIHQQLFVVP